MNTFRLWLAIPILPLLSMACGISPSDRFSTLSERYIFGGRPVLEGEWLNVVAIGRRDPNIGPGGIFLFCSGSLIHERIVLTAGHCIENVESDHLLIVGGTGLEGGIVSEEELSRRRALGLVAEVVDIKIHPDLRALPRGNADIGFIEITKLPNSDFGPAVSAAWDLESKLALMPNEGFAPSQKDPPLLSVIGYGRREDDGVGLKYQVDLPVREIDGSEALIGGEGHDSCEGDSGGPVMLPASHSPTGLLRQIGVVSRGFGIACGRGGIVTLTPEFMCWVFRNASLSKEEWGESPFSTWHGLTSLCARDEIQQGHEIAYTKAELNYFEKLPVEKLCSNLLLAHDADVRHGIKVLSKMSGLSCSSMVRNLQRKQSLDLSNVGLKNLMPLLFFKNLKTLNLRGNHLRRRGVAEVLARLPHLEALDASYNDIEDFDELKKAEERGLWIRGKNLQKSNFLKTKFKFFCAQTNLSPGLRHTIENIEGAMFSDDCEKANLRLARLDTLRLIGRHIVEVEPLAGLENLVSLDLSNNDIASVAPLATLSSLRRLVLKGNPVGDLRSLDALVARGLVISF